ncbi:MAG: glycosyltransferase [Candidatus Moranbacteria bacterium]|nr:glycosyltransferase [Candidatus Moranbacteria bacterium]
MKDEKQPQYSVVIPVYNESSKEEEMKEHLDSIKNYFEGKGWSYEIVVALDGPTDETPNLVRKHTQDNENVRILDRKINHGKGYTLREGLLAATGERRMFTDMDGATAIKMLNRLIPEMDKGADYVIGSRDIEGSEIDKHQFFLKEWLGKTGNLLIQFVGGLWGIKDTQCGFKLFTEQFTKDVIPRTKVDRWGIDFEILTIGKKLGYQMVQVPVQWDDKGESLVGLGGFGYLHTLRDLFKVRWNLIKGAYRLNRKMENIKK